MTARRGRLTQAPVLRLLGGFRVEGADGAVLMSASKPLALLSYLATVRGGRAGRTTLADMLWPDSPDGRALGSLRQALTTLRIKFGPEVIRTTDGILA